jgi:putative DNA primase/helicase
MTDYCRTLGPTLVAGGYLPLPILQGEKRPAISGWQKARLTSADLQRYPGHGVGVLCGQGDAPIVGVDVDISHPEIGPAVLAWCRTHLGDTAERIGAAPRVLLVYRAESAGWTKGYSVQFFDATDPVKASGKRNDQQVEILGFGQQFVAYHEHPDTHQPYDWTDLMGGIAGWAAADLPVVTESQIDALLVEVARLVRAAKGVEVLQDGEAPRFDANGDAVADLLALSDRIGMPFEEAVRWVSYLPNVGDVYDQWLKVGAALHHEYAGTDRAADALGLWKDYGARSNKDKPGSYDYKWRSFGNHSGSPVTMRWLKQQCLIAKTEHDLEVGREALAKVTDLINAQQDSVTMGSPTVLRQLKELAPEDDLLRAQIAKMFQSQYKVLTKVTLPITQVRTMLYGARVATVRHKKPLTEFGNASRMTEMFRGCMMFVPETDSWYLWTGVYWRRTTKVEIEHLAKETIKALPNEIEDHKDDAAEFYEFCAVSQRAYMVGNMVRLVSSDPDVAVPASELDKNTHLLGVRNGVVNLHTGELLPPDPSYRITLVASCNYDPSAKCPLFQRVLRDVFFDDMEMVSYFVRSLGYSMMGSPREEVMFIPFGNGSNGKSTLLGTVREVLGDYARSAEASSFIAGDAKTTNAGGPREDLVRLRGSRFVYVNEPDESGELREGAVKSMTGGDAISARGMHAPHSVEMVPTWAVWMPTNHKPIVKGSDNGIWRRLVLLPFMRNFSSDPKVERDLKLKDKLLLEKTGVLSLLVRAAIEYQKTGLVAPKSVEEARDSYRKDMDLLAEWIEECCDVGPNLSSSMQDLWRSWEQFAKERGNLGYVKSSIALGRRLEARFVRQKGTGGARLRNGIALKGRFEDEIVAGVAGVDLFLSPS